MTSHDDHQTVGTVDDNYSYDGDGRRVRKTNGSVATIFVYNAMGQMVVEYTGGSNSSQTGGTSYFTADNPGTPRVITNKDGVVISRHDYLPFGEEITSEVAGRATGNGYVIDKVRQKFTQKERDSETGLDYFGARYYVSMQGRFTSPDPYNIILESQATAEINPKKAQAQLIAYLGHPQQWNRYAYAVNNPLKYVDPTGEKIELTGSERDREIGIQRIKNLVGKDAAKSLFIREENGHYYVYSKDTTVSGAGELGKFIACMIDSSKTIEFRVATEFDTPSGSKSVLAYGGAATVGAEESLTGNTQIFVHPDAGNEATWRYGITNMGRAASSDGRQLDFYNDVVDGHEFGHAYANAIEGRPINSQESNNRALQLENLVRERRGLSNRRTKHEGLF